MTVQVSGPYPNYDVHKIIHAARNPTPDLIMVYAHRGARALGRTTENSFASVAAAAKAGYEGMEIDLRLTKDKQVVVWHDQGLGRNSDIAVPDGEQQYNPFTGKGYSPLVRDTSWFGEMEHLHLRDESGYPTLVDISRKLQLTAQDGAPHPVEGTVSGSTSVRS